MKVLLTAQQWMPYRNPQPFRNNRSSGTLSNMPMPGPKRESGWEWGWG